MPYRHLRGCSGWDLSDGEDNWPHLRHLPAASSRVNLGAHAEHLESVGDVHGGPALGRGAQQDPSADIISAAPGASASRTAGIGADAADEYAQDVHEAVAAMHASSSSASSGVTSFASASN